MFLKLLRFYFYHFPHICNKNIISKLKKLIKRILFYQNIFMNSLLIFFKNSDIIILEFGCYVFLQLSKLVRVTLFQCLSKVGKPKLDSRVHYTHCLLYHNSLFFARHIFNFFAWRRQKIERIHFIDSMKHKLLLLWPY